MLTLENGKTANSNGNGYYAFYNVTAGEHTITLQMDSLPVEYLPKKPLTYTFQVTEGVTYNYDIPLREVSNE